MPTHSYVPQALSICVDCALSLSELVLRLAGMHRSEVQQRGLPGGEIVW